MILFKNERIFSKAECRKKDLVAFWISLLEGAGWTKLTDGSDQELGYILNSKGETGDKDIYIQIMDGWRGRKLSNTNYCEFGIGLPYSYKDNIYLPTGRNKILNNIYGYPQLLNDIEYLWWYTYDEFGQYSNNIRYYDVSREQNTIFDCYYSINKNGLAFVLFYPEVDYYHYPNPFVLYIGYPDEYYTQESESVGAICLSSSFKCLYCAHDNVMTTKKPVEMYDTPVPYPPYPNISNERIYTNALTKFPNIANQYTMSEMSYGSDKHGIRGKIPCFYTTAAVPNLDEFSRNKYSKRKFKIESDGATKIYMSTGSVHGFGQCSFYTNNNIIFRIQ